MACLYRVPLVVNGTQGGRLSRAPETMKTAPESGSTPIKLSIIFQVKFNSYSYLEINVRSISVRVFEHLVDSCDIKWRFLTFLHISPSSVESVLSSQPIGVHPANSRLIKVWIKFVNHHFCEACFVLCFIFYCKGFTVFCFSTKLDLKSAYSGFVSESPPCIWSYDRHI